MAVAMFRSGSALSVGLIFFFLNLCFGGWLSRLPEVQRQLGLTDAELGLVLMGMPIGALISTTASRHLMQHFSPARLALAGISIFTLSMILPPLAGTALFLALALFSAGLTDGLTNVTMNTAASDLEVQRGINIMSACHGMFSLGGFAGGMLGGLLARMQVSLELQLLGVAILTLVVMWWRKDTLWDLPSGVSGERQRMRWPSWRLISYMVIGICIMIGEGAISDWSAIYLSKSLGAGPFLAALGFTGFSAAAATGRFGGDWVRKRISSRTLLRNGSLLSLLGLGITVFIPVPGLAIFGFTLAGLGFATSVPILFLEAAKLNPHHPGIGIAAVANTGLVGFLSAPPLIGFIAEKAGLDRAMLLLALLAGLAALLSHVSLPRPSR